MSGWRHREPTPLETAWLNEMPRELLEPYDYAVLIIWERPDGVQPVLWPMRLTPVLAKADA